jgi:hypothetical protein
LEKLFSLSMLIKEGLDFIFISLENLGSLIKESLLDVV